MVIASRTDASGKALTIVTHITGMSDVAHCDRKSGQLD